MKSSTSRYVTSLGDEGEFESGSHGRVLKNLLGIVSKREMDRVENEALERTDNYYSRHITTETVFTVELIHEMHFHFLGTIYAWAGRERTVDMSKDGFPFPPAIFLKTALSDFEQNHLRRLTPLRPAPIADIAKIIAEVHAEFLIIHPFRDGNGRIARLLAKLMALQASEAPPYYGFSGKGSKVQNRRYLKAVFEGYKENYQPLTDFFAEALKRGREMWFAGVTRRTGR